MELAQKLDSYGKPAWIALVVLGFIVWWPLGLAALAFAIGRGRMGCGSRFGFGRFQDDTSEALRSAFHRWNQSMPSSGNRAFDEYRQETLQRLEEEQKEFKDFLERLRQAKDKAEFDQFMADRRRNGASEGGQASGS